MTREMELLFDWKQSGEIVARFSSEPQDQNLREDIHSMGAIHLLDHALSTLELQFAISLVLELIEGIFTDQMVLKPTNRELTSASLRFKSSTSGIGISLFDAKHSKNANNENLQNAVKQLTINYIIGLLKNFSEESNVRLKVGLYDWFLVYDTTIDLREQGKLSTTKAKAALVVGLSNYTNKWPPPYANSEKLSTYKEHSASLEKKWKELDLASGKPIFF